MKLRVISFGKDRSGLFEPAVQEYRARLSHRVRVELLQLPESRGKNLTPELAQREEGRRLLRELDSKDWLVALDQKGDAWSSEQLARYIGEAQRSARDVTFAVGGDEGLSADILKRAHRVLSLSKMTLPHRMARLFLMEQLYRAYSILQGEPYHK